MKPKILYGILDDFGEVLKWQYTKPSKNYKYVTKRIKDDTVDWNDFEPALF